MVPSRIVEPTRAQLFALQEAVIEAVHEAGIGDALGVLASQHLVEGTPLNPPALDRAVTDSARRWGVEKVLGTERLRNAAERLSRATSPGRRASIKAAPFSNDPVSTAVLGMIQLGPTIFDTEEPIGDAVQGEALFFALKVDSTREQFLAALAQLGTDWWEQNVELDRKASPDYRERMRELSALPRVVRSQVAWAQTLGKRGDRWAAACACFGQLFPDFMNQYPNLSVPDERQLKLDVETFRDLAKAAPSRGI